MIAALIKKEIKDFWSNGFGLLAVGVLIVLAFLFLWVFQDSNYLSYGLADSALYFQFFSYLMLFLVPAFTVGFLANEYRFGTEELLRSLQVDWTKALIAKFFGGLSVVLLVLLLTSVHLFVVYQLSITPQEFPLSQIIGSYLGLIGIGACYIAITLCITAYVQQTAAAFILSVALCFMIYTGISLISDLAMFYGGLDFWIERFSLSYHADQIGRGILRLSSVIYFIALITWCIWLAAYRLNTKEV